jgi:hypothetical protein
MVTDWWGGQSDRIYLFLSLQGDGYRFFWRIRFLVAVTAVWDLLLFAKNLFFAAKIVWHEVPNRAASARLFGSCRPPCPTEHTRP